LPTAVPTVSAGGLKPLDSAACGDLVKAMGQTLGVKVAMGEAPFQDYVTGQAGTGCQAMVAGAGWDFVAVTKSLWAMLAAQGWQEDTMYAADGPTGAAGGFRQGDGLCLLAVEWKPSPDAKCPSDKPISDCQLKPEQQLYSISLNCAQGASSQPQVAGPTTIIHYIPQSPAGEARAGSCWTTSIAVPRAGAWRCMLDSEIHDPCFDLEAGKTVVCDANPATGEPGFKVSLTEPLPMPELPAQPPSAGWGWLVELADGTFCGPATGATFPVGDKPATYYCASAGTQKENVVLLGDIQVGPTWMAEKAIVAQSESGVELKKSEMMAIKTVWQ